MESGGHAIFTVMLLILAALEAHAMAESARTISYFSDNDSYYHLHGHFVHDVEELDNAIFLKARTARRMDALEELVQSERAPKSAFLMCNGADTLRLDFSGVRRCQGKGCVR